VAAGIDQFANRDIIAGFLKVAWRRVGGVFLFHYLV
jgi:hypothetical protein